MLPGALGGTTQLNFWTNSTSWNCKALAHEPPFDYLTGLERHLTDRDKVELHIKSALDVARKTVATALRIDQAELIPPK